MPCPWLQTEVAPATEGPDRRASQTNRIGSSTPCRALGPAAHGLAVSCESAGGRTIMEWARGLRQEPMSRASAVTRPPASQPNAG
jgi:hypothetical protein